MPQKPAAFFAPAAIADVSAHWCNAAGPGSISALPWPSWLDYFSARSSCLGSAIAELREQLRSNFPIGSGPDSMKLPALRPMPETGFQKTRRELKPLNPTTTSNLISPRYLLQLKREKTAIPHLLCHPERTRFYRRAEGSLAKPSWRVAEANQLCFNNQPGDWPTTQNPVNAKSLHQRWKFAPIMDASSSARLRSNSCWK
jgi:hypothetical protein